MIFSNQTKKLINLLAKLPGIGPRQATRLVFHLVNSEKETLTELIKTLDEVKNINTCPKCFFINEDKDEKFCYICRDESRSPSSIAILEKETDLISLERTNKWRGRYLILGDLKRGGFLNDNQNARLNTLKERIYQEHNGKIDEILVAISPTAFGDLAAQTIMKELYMLTNKITRIGRGLPIGGDIEFADEDTLSEALRNRN